jgi:hypothetical protein
VQPWWLTALASTKAKHGEGKLDSITVLALELSPWKFVLICQVCRTSFPTNFSKGKYVDRADDGWRVMKNAA